MNVAINLWLPLRGTPEEITAAWLEGATSREVVQGVVDFLIGARKGAVLN